MGIVPEVTREDDEDLAPSISNPPSGRISQRTKPDVPTKKKSRKNGISTKRRSFALFLSFLLSPR
jgi:hypothetical protein